MKPSENVLPYSNSWSLIPGDLEKQGRLTPSFVPVGPPSSPTPRATPYHIRQTAFLTTDMCQFSPYQLHFIQVFPGMVLVLLSEVNNDIL